MAINPWPCFLNHNYSLINIYEFYFSLEQIFEIFFWRVEEEKLSSRANSVSRFYSFLELIQELRALMLQYTSSKYLLTFYYAQAMADKLRRRGFRSFKQDYQNMMEVILIEILFRFLELNTISLRISWSLKFGCYLHLSVYKPWNICIKNECSHGRNEIHWRFKLKSLEVSSVLRAMHKFPQAFALPPSSFHLHTRTASIMYHNLYTTKRSGGVM